MNLIRREFLGLSGAALAAAALGMPEAAAGRHLAAFDSRLLDSRRFAERAAGDGRRLFDVAGQDAALWRAARSGFGLGAGETVIGLTRWSDWVSLRGLLIERGRRVAGELRLDCGSAGIADPYDALAGHKGGRTTALLRSRATGSLFAWAMA